MYWALQALVQSSQIGELPRDTEDDPEGPRKRDRKLGVHRRYCSFARSGRSASSKFSNN